MLEGTSVAVICAGPVANRAYEAALRLAAETGKNPAVYNIRYIKPVDERILDEAASNFHTIVTIEDGCIKGGLFGAVSEYVTERGLGCRVHPLGIPDRFVAQGTQNELRAECGYDAEGIYGTLKNEMLKF